MALEDLLDRAAEALLTGDLAALDALAPRLEAAAAEPPADRTAAERVQQKALRNARLLEAAGRGVKAARNRLAEITRGSTLTTYDAFGRKSAIAPLGTTPARRV